MSSAELLTSPTTPLVENNAFLPSRLPNGVNNDNDFLDTIIRLKASYADRLPEDRIIPSQEPQQPEVFTPINSEKYMQDVDRIRRLYYFGLGMQNGINDFRNYDPALARAMWEQLRTEEEKQKFVEHETTQIIKALGERYHVMESVAYYSIGPDSKLYSKAFPNEPFEEVVKRGIAHARNRGSVDLEREEAQLRGVLKVQDRMVAGSTLLNHKEVAVSGPGLRDGTDFTHNFVDIYEFVAEDPITRIRLVQMTRYASSATYEQYRAGVLKFKPQYFEGATGPEEYHYAANPLEFDPKTDPRSSAEIVEQLGRSVKGVLSQADFQKVVEDSKTSISYFLEKVRADVFIPEDVASRWNAVVNGADIFIHSLKDVARKIFKNISNFVKDIPVFKTYAEKNDWLGRQTVEQIMAACGLSGGFSLGGLTGFISRIASGIGRSLGIVEQDKYGSLVFDCHKCHKPNDRPRNGRRLSCKHCGVEFGGC